MMKGLSLNAYCTLSCVSLVLAMAVPSFAQRTPLDPMTVACVGATETTITVRVCAGSSGAPGGFSLQWIKKSDWEAGPDGILGTDDDNSWPLSDDPRICKASFSGQANETRWNLGPNDCRDITVGTLGDLIVDCGPSCGISTSCPGGLECGTEYVFRAFAHNEPGRGKRGRSPFSEDAFCSTQPCVPPSEYPECCTYSQGYFGNNEPTEQVPWGDCLPVTIGDSYRSRTFSTVAQVLNFLPAGGQSGQLNSDGTGGGTLAGQTLTLALNLCLCPELGNMVLCGFAEGNNAFAGFSLTADQAACLNGKTVWQILEAANAALGSGTVLCGLSFSQLNQLVGHLNLSLHVNEGCVPSPFALAHLKRSCP
jgi:hypothetical protein